MFDLCGWSCSLEKVAGLPSEWEFLPESHPSFYPLCHPILQIWEEIWYIPEFEDIVKMSKFVRLLYLQEKIIPLPIIRSTMVGRNLQIRILTKAWNFCLHRLTIDLTNGKNFGAMYWSMFLERRPLDLMEWQWFSMVANHWVNNPLYPMVQMVGKQPL